MVAAGLLLPLALVERPWQAFANASWVGFSVVLYTALLGTPAHIAYYHAVRTVGPSRAAVFMNLIPFLVLGLSWLMLGEPIRWYHWVGAIGVRSASTTKVMKAEVSARMAATAPITRLPRPPDGVVPARSAVVA